MIQRKSRALAVMLAVMVSAMSVLMLAIGFPAGGAVDQKKAQQPTAVERVNAASQDFITAISARDIRQMEKLWAHDSDVTFMGPLSTMIVVGWDGVRKAWEMRFGQFDRVTISLTESHVHTSGRNAWVVGIEKVQLSRKDGNTIGFNAFVTNVLEERDGNWLIMAHQATPMFREINRASPAIRRRAIS